jgi:hypothetical protein
VGLFGLAANATFDEDAFEESDHEVHKQMGAPDENLFNSYLLQSSREEEIP